MGTGAGRKPETGLVRRRRERGAAKARMIDSVSVCVCVCWYVGIEYEEDT